MPKDSKFGRNVRAFREATAAAATALVLSLSACGQDGASPTAVARAEQAAAVRAEARVTTPGLGAPRPEAPVTTSGLAVAAPEIRANGVARAAAMTRSALMSTSASDRAAWRRSLNAIARASKRGEDAVKYRRLILDAMESGDERALSSAAAAIPVEKFDARVTTDGVAGITRSYRLNGKARSSVFIPDADLGNMLDVVARDESFAPRTSGPSPTDPSIERSSYCESYYEGVLYTGECATQRQIDDVLALIAAIDAELEADYEEAHTACTWNYGEEACLADFNEELASAYSAVDDGGTSGARAAGPSAASAFPDAVPERCAPESLNCITEAAGAVASLVGWGLAQFGANSAMQAAAGVSTGAATAAAAGVVVAGFSVGLAIGSYLVCATS